MIFVACGVLGTLLIVGGYIAVQARRISATGWEYPASQLAGSILIGLSLIAQWNLATALLQLAVSGASIYGLWQIFGRDFLVKFCKYYIGRR